MHVSTTFFNGQGRHKILALFVYLKTQLSFRFCNRAVGELKAVYKQCKDFNGSPPGGVEGVGYSPRDRGNTFSEFMFPLYPGKKHLVETKDRDCYYIIPYKTNKLFKKIIVVGRRPFFQAPRFVLRSADESKIILPCRL